MNRGQRTTFESEMSTWINKDTGEEIKGNQVLREISRENFEIVYLNALCDIFDTLGSKKLKVLKVILQNKNYENICIMTQDKIAELAGVSRMTVIETLKMLEEKNIISKSNGVIFFNPEIINRGSHQKEKWLITKFKEFDEEKSITKINHTRFKREQNKIKRENKKALKNADENKSEPEELDLIPDEE